MTEKGKQLQLFSRLDMRVAGVSPKFPQSGVVSKQNRGRLRKQLCQLEEGKKTE